MVNWSYYESILFALMLWREARSEGEAGMRAVGHVAMNRSKRDKSSLVRVITLDAQFTSINPPKKSYDPQLDVWPLPLDSSFTDAMRIANEIIGGTSIDPTGGATEYWNPKVSIPGCWFDINIAKNRMYQNTAMIGQHDFYAKVSLPPASITPEHWGEES